MKKLLVLLGLVVTFFAIGLSGKQINAQQEGEERITLSPAISRPDLKTGQTADGDLTIINDGTTRYTFLLYARPFSVKGESYDPNYTEVNDRTEAYQWVEFEKNKLELGPNERVQVNYTVKVPEQAAPGGHYAVLFAETQPPNDGSSVARKKRVGSLLYMTVDGQIDEEGNLESWDIETLQRTKPLVGSVRIKNTGNVHFLSTTHVTFYNIFGKKRYDRSQETLVLPGTIRRVPIEWSDAPYFGIYKVSGDVRLLDRTENLPQKWVVLLPTSLIIVLAGVLVALFTWFVFRHHLQRRKRKV